MEHAPNPCPSIRAIRTPVRDLSAILEAELADLAAGNRLRSCPALAGASRQRPSAGSMGSGDQENQALLSFSSNDYLGFASHPEVLAAAAETAAREGFGAGAARLVTGDLPAHRALEADLATFARRQSALLFPTGYQANLGVVTALAGPSDLIVSDAANHASLIDGCRLSRATVAIYTHGNPHSAAQALARPGKFRRRFLLTESLFSMDGDSAPLSALAELAAANDAVFIVDEAHAFGVLGPGGRGLCAAAAVEPDLLVGTLGKAFGAAGGFVAASEAVRSSLVNRARTFIFTTASPPPVAAAARAALRLSLGPVGDQRRARLAANRARLIERMGGKVADAPGPIVPVIMGSDARALDAAAYLRRHHIFVPAIRPPTVTEGTARLRLTFSSEHSADEIDALSTVLAGAMAA
ncbi:MAG TPA: 8-amino-7-oxononanoate synthase [Polyangia bacterium]